MSTTATPLPYSPAIEAPIPLRLLKRAIALVDELEAYDADGTARVNLEKDLGDIVREIAAAAADIIPT